MQEILYTPEKILINEGEINEYLILLKEGKLETFSNFCDYKAIENNGIFGSEIILPGIKSFESVRVVENSRVVLMEKELIEKFLLSNYSLIVYLIKKYISKIISLNNKMFNSMKNENENIADKNLSKEEISKKYLNIYRRKKFNHIEDEEIKKYFKARNLFNKGNIKEALEELKKIHYSEFDIYFQAEIEIWKYLCTILLFPDKKYYLEKTLKEKYHFIRELFSFEIFERIITNSHLEKPLVTYLKSGYLIPANTVLFYEGEFGEWAFMILSGNVRVSKINAEEEKLLAILSNEEVVGEIACFKNVLRTATVFTSTPLQIIIIEKDNLDELVKGNPNFGLKIVKNLIKRLDFERYWNSPLSFEEKLNYMIKKYGKNILNSSKLKSEEIYDLFRLNNINKNELVKYLFKSNIATLRPDGTLKFL
ncbi:cyclic nucleotide-binding domain-containing protein [Marinitoga sp. 38H-ov]|uniref:cyclic nucleotide-binding domain-containing protein n=1 Tax=Marinitoga sp. 38H-ov TaxID=1755814 RepID=UPI0013EB7177|nr:cyclic nucleotide-binding domain-containing protein [Marinitoga sp. 38H-ov]KAF2957040.1 hypothetical protein AS160_03400 [Marinitoga sp. 38H-ov]